MIIMQIDNIFFFIQRKKNERKNVTCIPYEEYRSRTWRDMKYEKTRDLIRDWLLGYKVGLQCKADEKDQFSRGS